MPLPSRALALTLFCGALLVTGAAPPLAAAEIEGTNYRKVTPTQPTSSPGRIEVTEFFSYGCPHCSDFYPLVNAWAAKLPKDVVFKRVPVGFNRPQWINLARAYYALEASGDLAKLDGKLFHAIHYERLSLFDEQSLADWVGKNGGSPDKFAAAYTSFGVNNETVQADEMAEKYQVTGIPTMAVQGEYVALGDSFAEILTNTDGLIAKIRTEGAPTQGAAKHPPAK